ncbi:CLUMA_CG007083, isoform A [Clunio marinus]|uniref:CLUMA_CG007083, isoform A n=1 Tax=Clunio marinus TaxID=568069 RepID=A0A1J1I3V8_9DIPT|nr:CLUMA_CG007083, isoform A [Clunio marinus]
MTNLNKHSKDSFILCSCLSKNCLKFYRLPGLRIYTKNKVLELIEDRRNNNLLSIHTTKESKNVNVATLDNDDNIKRKISTNYIQCCGSTM